MGAIDWELEEMARSERAEMLEEETAPSSEPPSVSESENLPKLSTELAGEEGDLFDARPEEGHDQIEKVALKGVNELERIYFGNWARDMSQVIHPYFALAGDMAVARDLWEMMFFYAQRQAAHQFPHWKLLRAELGTYRWEEHVDNPRGFKGVIWNRDNYQIGNRDVDHPDRLPSKFWRISESGIPAYIGFARQQVLRELQRALELRKRGPRYLGWTYWHFGSAMHTLEDFYAHSNFVELALFLLKRGIISRCDPKFFVLRQADRQPVLNRYGYPLLTTGVFGPSDLLDSLQTQVINKLRPVAAHASVVSGFMNALMRQSLRRIIPASALVDVLKSIKLRESGLDSEDLSTLVSPAVVNKLKDHLRKVFSRQLSNLRWTGVSAVYINGRAVPVIEPHHRDLSKDKKGERHDIAADLAIKAVKDIWAIWSGRESGNLASYSNRLKLLMAHPASRGLAQPNNEGELWWLRIVQNR